MWNDDETGQFVMYPPDTPDNEPAKAKKVRAWSKPLSGLAYAPYFYLDLSKGHVDLFGNHYWELRSPWREKGRPLNTGVAPRKPIRSALSDILEPDPPRKYYLSKTACLGILRRARERGKELPEQLKTALELQAGLSPWNDPNIEHPTDAEPVGFDGYNGDVTHEVSSTLGVNCGMSTGRNGVITPIAFAENQRSEVRNLHDVAGALGASPGMKQQTFIAETAAKPFAAGVVTKGNGDCFLTSDRHTSLSGGGGQAGQGYPCVLTAAFSAGAGASAGGIGYSESAAPTLKGSQSGNCMPSILCLNDQGGGVMACTEDVSGTLRAQEHGHQPIVCDAYRQDERRNKSHRIRKKLDMYENYGIDARYNGPLDVAPTMSAYYGSGGNNQPLLAESSCFCIAGNTIDRQPQNGGNGLGYQEDIAYTLTTCDHHAVYSRQRVDVFKDDDVASTESARQHKDATDLVCDPKVFGQSQFGNYAPGCSTLRAQGGDHGGGSENLVISESRQECLLIRRLTPLECERLQGFPDLWTAVCGGADSARYTALGNSVAIPCVEFIMRGITAADALESDADDR